MFLVAFHKGGSVSGSATFELMLAVLAIYPLQGKSGFVSSLLIDSSDVDSLLCT